MNSGALIALIAYMNGLIGMVPNVRKLVKLTMKDSEPQLLLNLQKKIKLYSVIALILLSITFTLMILAVRYF